MLIHILNGDALYERFPSNIPGERIIMREALIEGPLPRLPMTEFFEIRAQYFDDTYPDAPYVYRKDVLGEMNKIWSATASHEFVLWFEDDLFCQINLWFLAYGLSDLIQLKSFSLVKAVADMAYGFGGMDYRQLSRAFNNRIYVDEARIRDLANLWVAYRDEDWQGMKSLVPSLDDVMINLEVTINCAMNNRAFYRKRGKLYEYLKMLHGRYGANDFVKLFRDFHKSRPEYGLGDLQVKRMLQLL